ncbi:hypothetical protein ILYODFUR_038842 [Ilyodon furcidens]|uniref:Amino acid transporter n=1 Tax=Ilyodon furcidens TaxID=33524 RepID=A0ABV0U2F3_9TELE
MMFISLFCFEGTLYRAVYLFSTKQYKTRKVRINVEPDDFNSTLEEDIEVHLVGKNIDGVNMPGLIAVSFFIGKTVGKIGNARKPFLEIITTVNGLSKDMVIMIMTYFPIAVVFMMTSYVYDTADRWQTAISLGKFVAVIFAGLVIHGVLVLPLICLLIVRRNPYLVIQGVTPALLRAMLVSRR